jgi:nucleoside-triphosphatase
MENWPGIWPASCCRIEVVRLLVFLFLFTCTYLLGDSIELSKKHILLTGVPGIGKSTIVKTVLKSLSGLARGVYAEEEVIDGERVGFVIRTLDGKSAYLSHQDLPSPYRVGKYGVNVEAIESLVLPAIAPSNGFLVVIDEIGLMQCCAPRFLEAVTNALECASCVLGTIPLHKTPELLAIKQRSDVQVIEVTAANRDVLPPILLEHFSNQLK